MPELKFCKQIVGAFWSVTQAVLKMPCDKAHNMEMPQDYDGLARFFKIKISSKAGFQKMVKIAPF